MFVQREAGAIVGVFSVAQPGLAEEELPEDHPEIVAFAGAARVAASQIDAHDLAVAIEALAEGRQVPPGTLTRIKGAKKDPPS